MEEWILCYFKNFLFNKRETFCLYTKYFFILENFNVKSQNHTKDVQKELAGGKHRD